VHPTAVKVERVLEALLKRHGGPPPPSAEPAPARPAPDRGQEDVLEEDVEEVPPEPE
jgi:hypothetical protein